MTNTEKLLHLLAQNRDIHLSGQQLANQLGVSRAAVWKAIETLRNQGHVIQGISNRGYQLQTATSLFSKPELESLLPSCSIHLFDSIDSTNRYAKTLASQNNGEKALVLALHQSGGRGRLGRSFYSPQGGVYMSLLLPATFSMEEAPLITSAAAVAVSDAIEQHCQKSCKIKWVNDLFYENRKVCGILTEGVLGVESGRLGAVVVGIGLNLYTKRDSFKDGLEKIATSLYDGFEAMPQDYSANQLVASIVNILEAYVANLSSRLFMDAYRERSMVLGKAVIVHEGKQDYRAVATGIDDQAHLVVVDENGIEHVLHSGEISIHLEV